MTEFGLQSAAKLSGDNSHIIDGGSIEENHSKGRECDLGLHSIAFIVGDNGQVESLD